MTPTDVTELDGRHALWCATVANLSPGFNQDAGLDLFAEGVVILRIGRRGPADRSAFAAVMSSPASLTRCPCRRPH